MTRAERRWQTFRYRRRRIRRCRWANWSHHKTAGLLVRRCVETEAHECRPWCYAKYSFDATDRNGKPYSWLTKSERREIDRVCGSAKREDLTTRYVHGERDWYMDGKTRQRKRMEIRYREQMRECGLESLISPQQRHRRSMNGYL